MGHYVPRLPAQRQAMGFRQMAPEPDSGTRTGFAVSRATPNGSSPRDYLRDFKIAGRNGLVALAFGSRNTAYLFERRADAEDIARRLRRRTTVGEYVYSVEDLRQPAAG